MKSKPVTPLLLFKLLLAFLCYLVVTVVWFFVAVPDLFNNPGDFDLIGGVFGICLWLIVTACLVLLISTPARRSPTTEQSSAVADSMHIDDRVRMAANARRYEWLRDRDRLANVDTELCVARDDTVYFGHDLDKNVDDAMRLARLEELHT